MPKRYIVAGAPCAGKSTFVRRHMSRGDLIFDYDTVHMALSGRSSHDHDPSIRPYVLAAREAIYRELIAHKDMPAWVITSTRSNSNLEELSDRLSADVILLTVNADEAHRRCEADDRPAAWHEYIDNWFRDTDIDPADYTMPEIKARSGMKKTKSLSFLGWKNQAAGAFTARFATIGPPPDHDGDITMPGAFPEGRTVPIGTYNHSSELPVGSGTIRTTSTEALVDGRFFLKTDRGREYYETLKELSQDTTVEWSYVFEILDSEPGTWEGQSVRYLRSIDPWSIDPVLRAAGRNTALVNIKSLKDIAVDDMDPLDVLIEIQRLKPWPETMTPATVLKQTMAPAAVKRQVALDLNAIVDAEIDDLRRVLKDRGSRLNCDVLRDQVAAAHPDASDRYVTYLVDVAVQGVAQQLLEVHVGEGWSELDAQRAAAAWATSPAGDFEY